MLRNLTFLKRGKAKALERFSGALFFRTAASQSVEVFVGQSRLFKEVSAAKGADDRETAGNRGGMECDAMGH